jgi:hypothetical protein
MGKRLKCGTRSEEVVHPCIKHSIKMTGNVSAINRTSELFQ